MALKMDPPTTPTSEKMIRTTWMELLILALQMWTQPRCFLRKLKIICQV